MRETRGKGQRGQDILTLQVLIVSQYLVNAHTRAQQLQDRLHRIAQAADAGLTMADGRVDGDAVLKFNDSATMAGFTN